MPLLRDLIDIPESLPPNRFVLRLTEGVQDPAATVAEYVVTPQLVKCFREALELVRDTVAKKSSNGTYLHGSFGSGKSHFMAVLHLILTGDPAARGIPELAEVIAQHNSWMGGKKFLLVPYHMIGATSLEDGILKGYCDFLTRTQPEVTLPAIYQSAALIDQARQERVRYGDEAFFRGLNQAAGQQSGWGNIEADWNAARFEAAAAAPPATGEHKALVGRLQEHYKRAAHVLSDYVNIDDGLAALSQHAHTLGYDGLVLFLDELMLWLAAHATDHTFLQVETAKLAKLVESQNADRPVPIASFIARQRDLKELVGEVPGADRVNYGDFVQWNTDRFKMITLEDRNLPVIAERRLLAPVSAAARAEIDAAFQRAKQVRASVREALLTTKGDDTMFRQVYPFTPALIKTLVAISSVLQRDRTALKVLSQLLVDHRDSLQVSDLVPVGDLFDVLIHGDSVTNTDVITHFEQAEKLYHTKLLPMLERQHGRSREELLALPADDPTRRLFLAHDRLLKTLLLAALVPDVESLRGMTAERLAALNHGTIAAPIAGGEVQIVAGQLRTWSGECGEIQLMGEPGNPSVSIQLSDVDTASVLQRAADQDNYGNRVKMIRTIVFREAFGISEEGLFEAEHVFEWRGVKRRASLQFANVRELSLDQLANRESQWKVIIDFPFDKDNHSPRDDLSAVDRFRAERSSSNTIVWVPAFFSQKTMNELGRLAVLDHVLSGDRFDEYAGGLSAVDRQQALQVLRSQRTSLHTRLTAAVQAAYGIDAAVAAGTLDDSHELDIADRFQSLASGLTLQPPARVTLLESLEGLVGQALAWQFPGAPEFGLPLTPARLGQVLRHVEAATQAADGRAEVPRDDRKLLQQLANPLQLGEMPHDGTHFVIGHHWQTHFTRCQAAEPGDLTVEKLRRWIDTPHKMGLTREAQNLVILSYASQTGQSFTLHGGAVEGKLSQLDDSWKLQQETPPDEADWLVAVPRAGSIFGVAVSRLCTAANAATLAKEVRNVATAHAAGAGTYARLLARRLDELGVPVEHADRLQTAEATQALLTEITQTDDRGVVSVLAAAAIPTSEAAVGECVKQAADWSRQLEGNLWPLVEKVSGLVDDQKARAEAILDDVRQALTSDAHVSTTPLAELLQTAAQRLLDVLVPPSPKPPPQPPQPPPHQGPGGKPKPPVNPIPAKGNERVAADKITARIAEIQQAHPAAVIEVEIHWRPGAE